MSPVLPYDEEKVLAELIRLARHETAFPGSRIEVQLGPWSAYQLIALLQLAYRHPSLNDDQRLLIKKVTGPLESHYDGPLAESIAAGWNPELDL